MKAPRILPPLEVRELVTSPADVRRLLKPVYTGREVELVVVMAMDTRGRATDMDILSIGGVGYAVVEPRVIFRWLLTRDGHVPASFVLSHNHPSGDMNPSAEDDRVTSTLYTGAQLVGFKMLDHVVYGEEHGFFSYAERGRLR